MKLIYKGIFKDYDDLPKGTLPQNAVKFKEPADLIRLNLIAPLFALPALLGVAMFIVVKPYIILYKNNIIYMA